MLKKGRFLLRYASPFIFLLYGCNATKQSSIVPIVYNRTIEYEVTGCQAKLAYKAKTITGNQYDLQKCMNIYYASHKSSYEVRGDDYSFVSPKRAIDVADTSNVLYGYVGGRKFLTGSIAINLWGDKITYIAAEAPFASDVFLSQLWRYNIGHIATVSSPSDSNVLKLATWRRSTNNATNLHTFSHISNNNVSFEYSIINPKVTYSSLLKGLHSTSATLLHFGQARKVREIEFNEWEYGKSISIHGLRIIVDAILSQYINGPLMVVSFDGRDKAKLIILAVHARILNMKKIYIDPKQLIQEYDQLAYGPHSQKIGANSFGWEKQNNKSVDSLRSYVFWLNSNIGK